MYEHKLPPLVRGFTYRTVLLEAVKTLKKAAKYCSPRNIDLFSCVL